MSKTKDYKKITKALEVHIKNWIEDNVDLIKIAQAVADRIVTYGLFDENINPLPFQILPTEVLNPSGYLECNLIIHLDNPAKGYYSISLNRTESGCMYTFSPPHVYEDEMLITYELNDIVNIIDAMAKDLDPVYELQELLINKELDKANTIVNNLLNIYLNNISEDKLNVIDTISNNSNIILGDESKDTFDYISNTNTNYDQVLLHEHMWFVLISENIDKNFSDFIDFDMTKKLRYEIAKFNLKETKESSILYLIQRIIKNMDLDFVAITNDDRELETSIDDTKFVYCVPLINVKQIIIK